MQDQAVQGFRLSPQQKRVWLLQRGGSSYCAQVALALAGRLDRVGLERALRSVIARHQILQTVFRRRPGIRVPLQAVAGGDQPEWRQLDLSGLPPDRQEIRLAELFKEESLLPFDFENGPLVRALLVALGGESHRLVLTLPALCADSHSLDNLALEIRRAYADPANGSCCDEPVQYLQFSEWQNDLLAEPEDPVGPDYWRRHGVSGAATAPPPFVQSADAGAFEPGRVSVSLPPQLLAAIDACALGHGVSRNAFLLAAWRTLLLRLGGGEDLTLSLLLDGRKHEELGEGIGLFAKSLPAPGRLRAGDRFRIEMERAEEILQGHYAWQDYFAWGDLDAAEISTPVFVFEIQRRSAAAAGGGILFSIADQFACCDPFTLKLVGIDAGSRFDLEIHYDAARVAARAAEHIAGYVLRLLQSAALAPDDPVGELEILPETERLRLIDGNQPPRSAVPPPGLAVHERFAAQAALTPGRLAVVADGEEVTYGELDARSNRLARHLRALGVGPEARVALCLRRTADLLVGLLGVLKAGGAYVPLDPGHPPERLAFLLVDSGATVLLTHAGLADSLPGPHRTVCLDRDMPRLSRESAGPLGGTPDPASLAYVIYTSGSTGKPKGVGVEHRQIASYLDAVLARLELEPGASYALVSTLAADLGNTVIFPALATGGTLHVLSQESASDPEAASAYFERHPVDCLKIVPSHLASLLETARPERVLPRRRLVVGGEASRRDWIRQIRELAPACRVLNHYGPTETTVGVLAAEADRPRGEGAWTDTVPLGTSLAHARVYLLDPCLRTVAEEVAGEIAIGGAAVARGYLGHPALTAERFVPDPWSVEPGGRMYRTGDLARWLPWGELEFLGRIDHQVKVRGYRVELGEIEQVLRSHARVREAVVVVHEKAAGDVRLVAYLVLAAGGSEGGPGARELREHVGSKLPEPMIPSAFVRLSQLPLSPNGKVDRRALAQRELAEEARPWTAPCTPVEEIVAEIWSEVLRLERVGVEESFFELGGHSLLATQVVSRVRESFGVELPLRSLFEAPTVRGLAARVEGARGGFVPPPIERADRGRPLPLSFAQQRLWFLQQMDPESTVYNIPGVYVLAGDLNVAALEGAIQKIVWRHEALRTTFPAVESEQVQRIHPPSPVRIPRIDLTALPAAARRPEAERLAVQEIHTPFDLVAGPVLRLLLLGLGEREHVLCFNLHHIISDGWSFGVIVGELTALYTSLAGGGLPELPELPVQYADFAAWQRGWLQGERLESELAFWRDQLAGAPPTLDLATDRPRPAVQSFRGTELPFRLEADLSRRLLALSRAEEVTPFMLLLAAYQALLAGYTRQNDLCVGAPIAGRNRREIEPLIGFFVNTLVLRAKLAGDREFRQILRQARERTLLAYSHQDLPFEKLVEELSPERSLAHTPLFQAALAWQHPAPAGQELPGLRLRPIELAGGTVKFDLMLSLRETQAGLEGAISYGSDLFDAVTIQRLLGHFRSLLESACARPDARLSELDLLGPAERRQLMTEGRARTALPAARCLHAGFEDLAQKRPEAVALEIEVETKDGPEIARVTYGELDRSANRLARYLRRQGVGPEVRVALCLETSPRMIAALLGVLKAGGAYVPLDPESPPERLSFLLADSGAPILLTESALLERLPEAWGSRAVCLDEITESVDRESSERPEPWAAPENLAYVIYTSGSTGHPKGSLITHANVVRLFAATEPSFGFGPEDVWTLFHSYAFDFSVWEIWGALLYGGRLVLVPFWVSRSPETFRELLARRGVTVLSQTPAAFRQLVETDAPDLPPLALRYVVFGGEALNVGSLEAWFSRYGDRSPELVNMYGITETTVHVTRRPLRRSDLERPWSSAIGQPLPDLGLHLLAKSCELSPLGAPGEIHVSGEGLGRGYLGRPELTAERFVPNPFAATPGERMYRSGDLARYRTDGELEYLGRIDHQVKVRGFRIELGEVEAALEAHSKVGTAAVLARETAAGDRRLVAYLVAEAGDAPQTAEILGFLRRRLPDYMVPADFVLLEHLPLTQNGKLDRRALAALARSGPLDGDWIAPRTPLEETVAGIWSEVLGRERVGARDDFFNLGGHSLLATQVIGRLRVALGREISLRLLFETRTVEQLARRLEDGGTAAAALPGPISIVSTAATDLDELLLELERSA
jgi:amino acid adenylation domain-containing protein